MAQRAALGAILFVLVGLAIPLTGQPPGSGFNERTVEKQKSPEDKAGIWMLDFFFKDPRVITVDLPGKGRSFVWYLWYQVSNNTGAPHKFEPLFVWVCHDEDTVHLDQVLPKAQEAVRRLEDADNVQDIKNSVTISKDVIPESKEFDDRGQRIAYPKLVTGVATWANINPKSTQFSIFVYGLSDGYTIVDGPDGKPIVRRKALQLKFKRLGDEFTQKSGQIKYMGHEWVYGTIDMPVPVLGDKPPLPKTDK